MSIEANYLRLPKDISIRDSGIRKGTAPADNHLNPIYWRDVDGTSIGHLYSYYKTDKTNSVRLQVSKMNSINDTDYASIGIEYPPTSNPYGWCPASDVNGSIVTTVNKSKTVEGYVQFGNGVIINWGSSSFNGSDSTKSASFSKAFTAAPKVMLTRNSGDTTANDGGDYYTRKITATGFELYRTSTNCGGCQWVAIGY